VKYFSQSIGLRAGSVCLNAMRIIHQNIDRVYASRDELRDTTK
jgi:hypothetical protein